MCCVFYEIITTDFKCFGIFIVDCNNFVAQSYGARIVKIDQHFDKVTGSYCQPAIRGEKHLRKWENRFTKYFTTILLEFSMPKIMPKLQSTSYIQKTYYEERKAFLRYDSLKNC